MDKYDRDKLFEDELLIVRHSGEIPEVALHGSLYFLTEDPDGPGYGLEEKECLELKKMAVERYREIIHRDLDPDNRDKSLYRGLARCIDNWHRLEKFCRKEGFDLVSIRDKTCKSLIDFINNETTEVAAKCRCSSVNCSERDLERFLKYMKIDCNELPEGWKKLCVDF